VTRFNEAIDQALAESVARFSQIALADANTERIRLDAILDAPVGLGMADKSGKMVLLNHENRRIWGDHPEAESVAQLDAWKGWWADGSSRHGLPLTANEWALTRALNLGESVRDIVEIEPFGAPGERRTILLHAEPIRDAIKNVIGSVMAQMDITEKIKMEAALRDSEAKFKTIANAMPQMVWSTRADGFHDYFNDQWYEFTGTTEETAVGALPWSTMLHPDDHDRAMKSWQHSLATGEVYDIQYRLRHHSGMYHWALGRALPIRNEAGNILRWMGTCTDINDQKLAEELLKKESKHKDEFLAMLAHELRNPLAPISTAAQVIKMVSSDETKVRSAADIITRQVTHMTDLVDDLLDVSRITRGLVELESEILDLKAVITGAIEQARPLIEARGHELHIFLTSSPAFVKGDKTRLVQVIANLLNNSSKYTANGGKITVTLEVSEALACIKVSDNGSGIAPNLLPQIFDLFTQGERTPDRKQGGLGLGLSLVKNITLLHGGTATAESEGLGRGSQFMIDLPLVKGASITAAAAMPFDLGAQAAVPLRLMLVDDNVDAAQLLAGLLAATGHEVTVAEDAAEALASPAKASVQVFILDIGLPGMDGFELARTLRADPATQNAVLIALTGYGQAHDRILTKAAGFDHHFVKPVDIEALSKVLSERGWQERRQTPRKN
jgi:PAS domain S-box-containing protein